LHSHFLNNPCYDQEKSNVPCVFLHTFVLPLNALGRPKIAYISTYHGMLVHSSCNYYPRCVSAINYYSYIYLSLLCHYLKCLLGGYTYPQKNLNETCLHSKTIIYAPTNQRQLWVFCDLKLIKFLFAAFFLFSGLSRQRNRLHRFYQFIILK
jgi:hypothetical protein